VDVANQLIAWSLERGETVVASQDWHPANHGSFASQHQIEPYTQGELDGLGKRSGRITAYKIAKARRCIRCSNSRILPPYSTKAKIRPLIATAPFSTTATGRKRSSMHGCASAASVS
jgi:nicotinamidase-related amidase